MQVPAEQEEAEAETAQPSWLRDVDQEQKHAILKLVSRSAQHYGNVNSPFLRDYLQGKFGISSTQAGEVITWMSATNEVNLSVPDCN